MNDLIKSNLKLIQDKCKDLLEDVVVHLRVTKAGNIQIYLNEQLDTSQQEDFKTSIETLDNLTINYQANLDTFGEPVPYKDKNGNKKYKSPAIIIHEIGEPKDLDDMFSDLVE